MNSPAAAVAAAYREVCAAMPPDLLPYGRTSIVIGNAAAMIPPRPFPSTATSSRMHVAIRRTTLPHLTFLPVRCTQLGRTASREICRHVSPRLPVSPTSASQLAEAAVAAAAAVAECTRPRRET